MKKKTGEENLHSSLTLKGDPRLRGDDTLKAERPHSCLRASIASELIPQRHGVPTSYLLQANQSFRIL